MVTSGITSFEERVAQVLEEAGFVTPDQMAQARSTAEQQGTSLLDTLMPL